MENPPAFPRDHRHLGHNGMTLRDWFAGQVMSSVYTDLMKGDTDAPSCMTEEETFAQVIARWSYELADAMLKAREAE